MVDVANNVLFLLFLLSDLSNYYELQIADFGPTSDGHHADRKVLTGNLNEETLRQKHPSFGAKVLKRMRKFFRD